MTRVLWLHTGGAKAGSSALQAQFANSASILAKNGLAYLHSPEMLRPDQISSGNGMKLYRALVDCEHDESSISAVLEDYFGGAGSALCSSELLSHLEDNHIALLARASKLSSISLKFIFVVRDPIPYFISAYRQRVKRHGEKRSLQEFLLDDTLDYQHALHLRRLVESFPLNDISVLHYDSVKTSLVQTVFDLLQINLSSDSDYDPQRLVNRSLTGLESELIRTLNSKLPTQLTTKLTDALVYENPDLDSEFQCSDWIAEEVGRRHHGEIVWINETFWPESSLLKVPTGCADRAEDLDQAAHLSDEARSSTAIVSWLAKLWDPVGDEFSDVTPPPLLPIISILAKVSVPFRDSLVDQNWYYSQYSDVREAGVSPTEHYFSSGAYEYRSPRPDLMVFIQQFIQAKWPTGS